MQFGRSKHLASSAVAEYPTVGRKGNSNGQRQTYGIAQEHADVLSPFELVLRRASTVATPNFDLLQPGNQSIDDHFWQSQVLADGVAACDLNFMVLNKACLVLGYFRGRCRSRPLRARSFNR
ncbi:hypothetical protein D6B98_38625 [Bradyrhizobium sp. LVM 105]|uniref:Uncharacterized protein n=1 Tax=Bradyrhizobium frederickii TaxID=2560054 RepID=A0A4Y9NJ28_9BRAD|nr:hypothetical protein D6B98_38625 [Bradyrhizobium sp. LVM 105]TFV29347.1 hypothetical protein E4K66_38425 [Bradyrhizobium frederickii]TFV67694.1 hypothetical protein E4K64_38205 [Bradyrhizobium frederickii]